MTTTLLHLQHAFEMLLKAALQQAKVPVFDRQTGRSIGFDKAVELGRHATILKLTEVEAGTLRAVDALRDDEQHWITDLSEGQLYLHVRAGITLFDDLLTRAFGERLADHLPRRVLPVSVEPPQDFIQLVDRDFSQIADLLRPGRRARATARAKIRGLLALEAHVESDTRVSDADVNRVETGIRAGKTREQVFPRLSNVGAQIASDGVSVTVRFSKVEGAPVRLVRKEDDVEAAAIREVDLQKKYHWSIPDLAAKLNLSGPRFHALRIHLALDDDPTCLNVFIFGSQRHPRYSDNALTKCRDAIGVLDMDEVWSAHRPGARSKKSACSQAGCACDAAMLEEVS